LLLETHHYNSCTGFPLNKGLFCAYSHEMCEMNTLEGHILLATCYICKTSKLILVKFSIGGGATLKVREI